MKLLKPVGQTLKRSHFPGLYKAISEAGEPHMALIDHSITHLAVFDEDRQEWSLVCGMPIEQVHSTKALTPLVTCRKCKATLHVQKLRYG